MGNVLSPRSNRNSAVIPIASEYNVPLHRSLSLVRIPSFSEKANMYSNALHTIVPFESSSTYVFSLIPVSRNKFNVSLTDFVDNTFIMETTMIEVIAQNVSITVIICYNLVG
jgi:hypothetical protein